MGVVDPGVQSAVGASRAALAELDVAFRVQLSVRIFPPSLRDAAPDRESSVNMIDSAATATAADNGCARLICGFSAEIIHNKR